MDTTISAVTERAPQSNPHLKGNMGFFELIFSVLAYNAPMVVVIGIIPIMVMEGAGLGTPMSFIGAGIILALFSVGFTRMARVLPNPGGFYALITAGLGREVGLGSGYWALLTYFCVYAGTFSFGGVMLGELVANTFHGPELPWYVWGAVFWIGSAILGYLKVELSAKVLAFFLLAELLIIVAYDALVFFQGGANGAGVSWEPLSPAHWFDGNFSLGLMLAIGMYGGFEVTVLFREEVRNPARTIPRATCAVIAVAMTIYAISSIMFMGSLGTDQAVAITTADPTGAMNTSLLNFGGKLLQDLATVMVNTSTFAVILAAHNITARYVFNLGADNILPARVAAVHKRHGSPHVASIATSIAALALNGIAVIIGLDPLAFYAAMLGMTSFMGLAIIFICNIAVAVYMRRAGGALASKWATVICPILAGVGLGIGLILAAINFPMMVGGSQLLANILMAVEAGVFILGCATATVYKRRKPECYSRIGRQ
ncbi:APC family permease [Arthrobacter sp. ISL-30]|uniref:APC family permease n=1 Tax=Arthrobacter sp. ISL-30 TaxID=2819109 RepID=UPI001BE6DDD0|nr:APC family permease [Arthrobacter sp. ISL-30]MBT2514717.1 APC family permease [Arthrobacter sp. ISL-30]